MKFSHFRSERQFHLLDPARPFSIPSNLENDIKSFESTYSGVVRPSVASPAPVVVPPTGIAAKRPRTDPTPANAVSTSSSATEVGSVAKEENVEDIKETIYRLVLEKIRCQGKAKLRGGIGGKCPRPRPPPQINTKQWEKGRRKCVKEKKGSMERLNSTTKSCSGPPPEWRQQGGGGG